MRPFVIVEVYGLPKRLPDLYDNHQDWYEFNIKNMDEETVGVESLSPDNLPQPAPCPHRRGVYDLSGRKMNVNENNRSATIGDACLSKNVNVNNSKLKKGIYIVNGKKMLVK